MATLDCATRVLVKVSRRSPSPSYDDAWKFPEKIIHAAVNLMRECHFLPPDSAPNPLFVAKDRWSNATRIVFDLFHDTYNPDDAHLPGQNDLPVIVVYFTSKGKANPQSIQKAKAGVEVEVNKTIRDLYDMNGFGSRPPFAEDHTNGNVPTYFNSRSLIRVDSGQLGGGES